jgi:hypothetical protein
MINELHQRSRKLAIRAICWLGHGYVRKLSHFGRLAILQLRAIVCSYFEAMSWLSGRPRASASWTGIHVARGIFGES